MLAHIDFITSDDDIFFVNELAQVISKFYIFYSILFWIHLLIVIPGNVLTIFVITKTKALWTYSNLVLSINGFFMVLGSVVALFGRVTGYPLLLYNEVQRETAYAIGWWAYTLTFRIGNNR